MKIYDFNGKKNICGSQIRLARVKRKLTQSDLAVKMQLEGVILEQNGISQIELKKRIITDYELLTFAKVLKTDIGRLLSDGEDTAD